MSATKPLLTILLLATLTLAQQDSGGYIDLPSSPAIKKLAEAPFPPAPPSSLRAISRKACSCKCATGPSARRQCRNLCAFCAVSQCSTKAGKRGRKCCRKDSAFGRCECLSGRSTIAISATSEFIARRNVAHYCALEFNCPPNCNCGSCPIKNELCFKLSDKNVTVWACRADCVGSDTRCARIPGE